MSRRWVFVHVVIGMAIVVAAGALIFVSSDPKADGLTTAGLLVVSFIPLVCGGVVVLLQALLSAKDVRRHVALRGLAILTVYVAILAVAVIVTALEWPFRVRFALSRAALESAAVQARVETPRRLGLFTVQSIDKDPDGTVRLHLGDCSWYRACDFVFHPKADCLRSATGDGAVIDARWCLERVDGGF